MTDQSCARCGRPSPDPIPGSIPIDWEVLDAEGEQVICSGCITGAEQQAIDEDYVEMIETTPLGDATDPRGDPIEDGR